MKNPAKILIDLCGAATELVLLKRLSLRRRMRRAVSRHVFLKQYEGTEKRLADALAPVIEAQVREMADGLRELAADKASRQDDTAEALITQVNDTKRWRAELIDRALPILAVEMAKAVKAQRAEIGMEFKQ